MKAVFLDWRSLDQDDLDPTPLKVVVDELVFYPSSDPDEARRRSDGSVVLISNKVRVGPDVLDAASALRLVCVAATGTNNVDLEATRARGVVVSNVRAYGTASVVQHVFSLMIALNNRLLDYHEAVVHGQWQRSSQFCLLDYPIREIAGKTLGIVGFGELGQGVARIAEAFGMRVLVARRGPDDARPGRLSLHELLAEVDVLSLHCPLTEQNRNLIGSRELALMKPTAMLINTARGGLVDEAALAASLREGRLAGAAVDVLSQEPPTDDNPLLQPGLPNVIVTPHIAWASREARQRIVDQLAENIAAFRRGAPMRVV